MTVIDCKSDLEIGGQPVQCAHTFYETPLRAVMDSPRDVPIAAVKTRLAQRLDQVMLATFNTQIPDTFQKTYHLTPSLEEVLGRTRVRFPLTPSLGWLRAGEYRFWLDCDFGRIPLHLRIQPAQRLDAPLLLYHHGLAERPYDGRARRLFSPPERFDAHVVMLQAPFHRTTFDALRRGMQSMHHLYQMLMGSVRMMDMVQTYYENLGVPYTIAVGTSLGGIISILYEGLLGRTAAVVPIIASPDMGRVMWDAAHLVGRKLQVGREVFDHYLNFTPYFQRADPAKFFPLLSEADVFFLKQYHAGIFEEHQCPIDWLPAESHITGALRLEASRQRIIQALITTRQRQQTMRPTAAYQTWNPRRPGNKQAGGRSYE